MVLPFGSEVGLSGNTWINKHIFSRVFSDSVENGSNIKLDMAELVVYRNEL